MHIWNYRSSTFPYPRRFYQKKYICTDLGVEKQMYKDIRLSTYYLCTKRKCTKCCHTESRFKEILCKYVRRLQWMDVQLLLLKSWLPCYVLLALFEKGQLGKKMDTLQGKVQLASRACTLQKQKGVRKWKRSRNQLACASCPPKQGQLSIVQQPMNS